MYSTIISVQVMYISHPSLIFSLQYLKNILSYSSRINFTCSESIIDSWKFNVNLIYSILKAIQLLFNRYLIHIHWILLPCNEQFNILNQYPLNLFTVRNGPSWHYNPKAFFLSCINCPTLNWSLELLKYLIQRNVKELYVHTFIHVQMCIHILKQ